MMHHIQSLFGLLGRACIAAIFILSGIGKIASWNQTLVEMTQVGVPYTQIALVIAIIFEIVLGLGILLGWYLRTSATLLALYLIAVTYFFHNFWTVTDPTQQYMQLIHFLKNLAILGGLIVLVSGPGSYTIDENN